MSNKYKIHNERLIQSTARYPTIIRARTPESSSPLTASLPAALDHAHPRYLVLAEVALEVHGVTLARSGGLVAATTIVRRVEVRTIELGLAEALVDEIMHEAKPCCCCSPRGCLRGRQSIHGVHEQR